ncbi:MAG TPA: metalloregulator ArsR/SmtB family transcription factor [Thermoanaerobaculia bacterium]|jgi:DNA-binding transcriptional ArsR family regulator
MSARQASVVRRRLEGSAPVFAALGDETRLRLVARLSVGGPFSIARLTEGSKVTRQAVTKHLHVLAGAGLVRDVRAGRERLWELNTPPLDEARKCLEIISDQWDGALGRLQRLVDLDAGRDQVFLAGRTPAKHDQVARKI